MYIDAHCHLENEAFATDFDKVLDNMRSNNIIYCICAGSDIDTSNKIFNLSKKHKEIYGTVGVHPHEAKFFNDNTFLELTKLLSSKKILGIGEIGLDYFYEYTDRDMQKEVLKRQIEFAIELDLPLMFHVRDAHHDMLDILKKYNIRKGVMHCFSGSLEIAKEYLKKGFILSFAGPITFKNSSKLPEVVKYTPIDRIFVETDSPYLTPVPFRGTRNEPSKVIEVYKKISELKNIEISILKEQVKKNLSNFYNVNF